MGTVRIHLLVFQGVLDASLGISLSIFQTANSVLRALRQPAVFEVTVTAMRSGQFVTGAGLTLQIPKAVTDLETPDLLLLPGNFLSTPKDMDDWLASPEVVDACHYLKSVSGARSAASCAVAASCVATFVLAQAGLLKDRQATTVWWLARQFRQRFPGVKLDMQRMVVQDGRITTAGAALAQGDLVLQLISQYAGAQLAHTCARYLLMDERGSQSGYAMLQQMALQDPQMRQAESWVRKRLERQIRISDLAQALHLTPRTLARRFESALGMTPLQFVQRLRIDHALHLLQTTSQSLEVIAPQVGYADSNALRRLIRREVGLTPVQLRRG